MLSILYDFKDESLLKRATSNSEMNVHVCQPLYKAALPSLLLWMSKLCSGEECLASVLTRSLCSPQIARYLVGKVLGAHRESFKSWTRVNFSRWPNVGISVNQMVRWS